RSAARAAGTGRWCWARCSPSTSVRWESRCRWTTATGSASEPVVAGARPAEGGQRRDAPLSVVAVGGGHGLSRVLAALRRLDVVATAVVTVADDGGSSGRLRRDLGIIPPGDLRMALLGLAGNTALADLLGHRFRRGELSGHALGNLALVALAEQHDGDFVAALDHAAALLACRGRVLPATLAQVQLKARVSGAQVDGQAHVTRSGGHVERVWLEPSDPPVCAEAVSAVAAADAIVLGPGSLFTSVIAALLVPGLAAAITAAAAPV